MKEDLIKIINFKLKSIKDNIDSFNNINSQINKENDHLKYIDTAIDSFKENSDDFNIYNFVKIKRDDFNKLLMELDDGVLKVFGTESCNYEGLIYLINGINDGISLTLTDEQKSAISFLIDELLHKKSVYQKRIEELNNNIAKLENADLDMLINLKNEYAMLLEDIGDNKYLLDVDLVIEAIVYSNLSKEKTFDLLCYLLKYNATIYDEHKNEVVSNNIEEAHENKEYENPSLEEIDLSIPYVESNSEEIDNSSLQLEDTGLIKNEFSPLDEVSLPPSEKLSTEEISSSNKVPNSSNDTLFENQDFVPLTDINNDEDNVLPAKDVTETNDLINNENEVNEENKIDLPVENEEIFNENNEDHSLIDDNFNDLTSDDYEPVLPPEDNLDINNNDENLSFLVDEQPLVDENSMSDNIGGVNKITEETEHEKVESESNDLINEEELINLFNEFGLECTDENLNKDLLLNADINNYRNILNKLKELNVISLFENNFEILFQILLSSKLENILKIEEIVGESLSVDDNDKEMTLETIFKTMPSVFIDGDNGNYDNFVKNVVSLKEYGVDLIKLFDFSREVLIVNHEFMVNNYNIIRSYDLTLNDRNAKYFLLLPNIREKLDYYVESLYPENLKGRKSELFDGIDLIKLYPSKLNIVKDETIKRLRYASSSGRKIFGLKEKSLTGEISNLKIDVINMPDDYKNSFFNNEFDVIPRDEVESFIKMVNANIKVNDNVIGLLNELENYRNGLRYNILDINVSRNKVIHNYNILVNNGIPEGKALLFAVCYNLVVSKEEYGKLKDFVLGLGGK